ncbi:hypothetical protein DACRYDRAFT_116080 [Dacryopinax primogenitus]|uniref:Large ribosomal subunit protein mL59 domain-containing protein n=1 Tax=Dacryopinax primogenitus (strain DJM 731) TaxID=1858805 RepID=M5G923_DACPD|nr:uncharacterized protein DACRYDRAFT_116080 [Dacryopinax primogenitus]EJU02372.1 hypothetical protein DACRYDRAFT_116080 [Dacryopinax primogenitus]
MAALLPRTPASPILTRFFARTHKKALSALPDNIRTTPPRPIPAANPFIPRFNPDSRCWAPPEYSKRRQIELLKAAQDEGFSQWMPCAEGERVGGGRKGQRAAHAAAAAVTAHESVQEGGVEEIGDQGGSTIVASASTPDAPTSSLLVAAVAQKAVKRQHKSKTNTTPQQITDPEAPFLWIGIPNPVYAHETVYGAKTRQKWFKGHRWEREKVERQKRVKKNIETMDERIKDWRDNRVSKRQEARLQSGLPF